MCRRSVRPLDQFLPCRDRPIRPGHAALRSNGIGVLFSSDDEKALTHRTAADWTYDHLGWRSRRRRLHIPLSQNGQAAPPRPAIPPRHAVIAVEVAFADDDGRLARIGWFRRLTRSRPISRANQVRAAPETASDSSCSPGSRVDTEAQAF